MEKGLIVKALAGREKDNFFVVTAVESNFCYLADGKERPLAKPKKKSQKHIAPTRKVIDIEGLTDKKLRKLLTDLFDLGG